MIRFFRGIQEAGFGLVLAAAVAHFVGYSRMNAPRPPLTQTRWTGKTRIVGFAGVAVVAVGVVGRWIAAAVA